MIRWGQQYQNSQNNSQGSLFGAFDTQEVMPPSPPQAEPWNSIEKLEHEVEVAAFI
ncbi:MAG: hypothetical protein IPG87_18120 [Saprospiraceae bacterium]|nr:hypothetical protein [Candidatus Vicinibacter affinis]